MPDSTVRSSQRSTSRSTRIVLSVLALLVAIAAVALLIARYYDWNQARPWLNAKASEALGRPFAIRGALSLEWARPSVEGRKASWRDQIPWPHLSAHDVHISNPAGMPARDMASIGQLAFSLDPFALLSKTIAIPQLRLAAPSVELVRHADGANNWTFRHLDKPSPWTLDLEQVVLSEGVLRLADAIGHAELTADVDTLSADPLYGVGWKLHGTYNGAPVTGSGKAGAVLSLKQQNTPFPLQAQLRMGATRISVQGSITRPAQLAAIDLQLKLAGASMARLYNLTGILLPETPAFSTEGRLVGHIDGPDSDWTYEQFKGKVGSSDIGGRLAFRTAKPRGMLSGEVVSHLLSLSDLGPLVGADSNASKSARGVAPVQPPGKVLPVETFRTERWKSMDVDVRFSAERIVRDKQLPISNLSTHLRMQAGVLTLEPLNFDMAGGSMASIIRLDGSGSGSEGKEAIQASAKVTARHLKIKQLFPRIEQMQATVGEINGDARLSASGNSVATLLASANGEVKTLINQGSVSKLLLEEMGLNIGNIVLTKLFGDKPVTLNCMATDFGVINGLMQTRTFVVDTDEAVITAEGSVNLANEQIALTLRPETKSLRIFSLRAPLHVRGPFSNPDVSVDKGVLALKAGGAATLALVAAPVAALLPLINTGPGQDSACAKLLAAARVKPVAPAPRAKR